jgi:anti-sigma-K factor RskA
VDDRLREQLVGYALGALDDTEQSEIEQRLSVDPELRRALESVQQSLEPLVESYEEYEAPPGLAATACGYVAEEASRLDSIQPGLSRAHDALHARSRWALADWVVMVGICAAALCLFFPAIANSRFLARVTACQDNLRQLGTSLVQYSEYAGNG